ncbi:hypothetical protein TNCV_3318981 [Trichonephila clavipes]|nr:hypothetical protein TNCV_3318981 [Trichonephila clavipes]
MPEETASRSYAMRITTWGPELLSFVKNSPLPFLHFQWHHISAFDGCQRITRVSEHIVFGHKRRASSVPPGRVQRFPVPGACHPRFPARTRTGQRLQWDFSRGRPLAEPRISCSRSLKLSKS